MSRILRVRPHSRARVTSAALALGALTALVAAGPVSAADRGKPAKPKPVRVVAKTTTSVVLSWKRTAPRFVVKKNSKRVGLTRSTRFSFERLSCGRKYRLKVRAVAKAGKRSAVVRKKVRTRACPPAPPAPPGEPGPTGPPAPSAPANAQLPQANGTAHVGHVLTASNGSWTGTLPISFAYQWQRCNPSGQGCAPVSGATGVSYILGAADAGQRVRLRVTATNSAGSAQSFSLLTGAVATAQPGSCTRSDATGCAAVAGSKITLLNQRFSCDRPLAEIAAANPIGPGPGTLPLLVEVGFTTWVDLNPAVIELRNGCRGDGNDSTIDLVLRVEGDGRTYGGTGDAVKVRLTASDVQLTGYANCGPRTAASHQDGAQIQGASKVEFIDFEWGDWDTSTATCQGAGGTFLPGSVNNNPVLDVSCIRCTSVSCNHGMVVSVSERTLVVDSKWRTGNPADRTVLLATGVTGLCSAGSPACLVPPGEAINYVILNNYCDRWPYGDGS